MSAETRTWDETYDVVVVGSGAAGLAGAVAAALAGQSVLIVEKEAVWGGTTGYSGGGLWIPRNRFLRSAGVHDSEEDALAYLEATVGDGGPATSPERKAAYLRGCLELVERLTARGFRWTHASRYPDYYPGRPGAKVGRGIEPAIFDAKRLGALRESMIVPEGRPPIAIQADDLAPLQLTFRTPRMFARTLRILGRSAAWYARGRVPFGAGQALLGQLMWILQQTSPTPILLETPLRNLVVEDGRVTGVAVERDGRLLRVEARRAVLLAAGGFSRNDELRRRHQPVGADWTAAAPGDTGDAVVAGVAAGAALAQMENAWWCPTFKLGDTVFPSLWERSLPGSIIVDQGGRRFADESGSYIDVGRAMLERDRDGGGTVPSWLILDGRHRRRYLCGPMPPRRTPGRLIADGSVIKAPSIDELARHCGIDATTLGETVARFNGFARSGKDEEFGRGEDVHDRFYSDPTITPNPNLGPIDTPPFWALRLVPGDAGTSGGLLTDEHARVLRDDGSPIEGLYASGNTSASVMGPVYVGPGSTLGPAMTFAYLAMQHAASTTPGDTAAR